MHSSLNIKSSYTKKTITENSQASYKHAKDTTFPQEPYSRTIKQTHSHKKESLSTSSLHGNGYSPPNTYFSKRTCASISSTRKQDRRTKSPPSERTYPADTSSKQVATSQQSSAKNMKTTTLLLHINTPPTTPHKKYVTTN